MAISELSVNDEYEDFHEGILYSQMKNWNLLDGFAIYFWGGWDLLGV